MCKWKLKWAEIDRETGGETKIKSNASGLIGLNWIAFDVKPNTMIWNKFLAYQAEHNHKDKRLTLRIGYAINLVVSKLHSTSFSFMSFWSFEQIQRKQSYKNKSKWKLSNRRNLFFFSFYFFSLSTFYIFVFNLWVELIYLKLFRFSARSIKSKSNTCTNVKQKPNYFWRQVFFENHREFKEDKKETIILRVKKGIQNFKQQQNEMKWTIYSIHLHNFG